MDGQGEEQRMAPWPGAGGNSEQIFRQSSVTPFPCRELICPRRLRWRRRQKDARQSTRVMNIEPIATAAAMK
jgi:hypothetical protein